MSKMNKSEAGKLGAIKTSIILKIRRLKRIDDYNNQPNLCAECSNSIEYNKRKNKFCSHSCSAKFSNTKRERKINFSKCLNCLQQIQKRNKYCSNTCLQDFIRNEKLKQNKISSLSLRTFLIKKYGAICMECGWSKQNPYTKTIPIELEHIDGNSENNTLENVKLLCPSCHSLTPTYKGANMGNGRFKRRERYKNGQSS